MIDHTQLRKGVRIILDNEPYEILESMPLKKAQRRVVIQAKIKNLINGNVFDRNFHQGDVFEEAELNKFQAKFLYSHKDKFVFCLPPHQTKTTSLEQEKKHSQSSLWCGGKKIDPSKRFELTKEQISSVIRFLKPNQIVEGIIFKQEIVNISLPIKIQIKVTQAPPGIKGERAQAGNKVVVLETGTEINVPLFIEEGDLIEINTEKGEYVRRVEKK